MGNTAAVTEGGTDVAILKSCTCLEIFQFDAGKGDRVYAMKNDLASDSINFAALRRTKTSTSLTPEEGAILQGVLKLVDVNHDGKMGKDEIKRYFDEHHNPLLPGEIDEMIDIADKDKSGYIELEEFKILCKKIQRASHRSLARRPMIK
eukprot:gnl/TRDRNA2_/TRDRNA2_142024_c0_seq1.p1 gnl/TRDRNA2_/TRDRNA2_142024_c0~~gnl/TRDRNA2_/TRDRNA2_142024_c0_seq1.p1  ORF type:complete len:149 (+),score=28.80 gnl/TRDRNA2_/TRDRNA2_142024_c0_seq1:148-594(+)